MVIASMPLSIMVFAQNPTESEILAEAQHQIEVEKDYFMGLSSLSKLEDRSGSAGVQLLKAKAYFGLGNMDSSLIYVNRLLNLKPKLSTAYVMRGTIYMNLGSSEKGMDDLDHAILLAPKSVLAYNKRAAFHNLLGNYDACMADYDQAIKINPRNDTSHLMKALIMLSSNKDTLGAISVLSEKLKKDKRYAEAYHLRGALNGTIGELTQSIEDLSLAIEYYPLSKLNFKDCNIVFAYYDRSLTYYKLKDQMNECNDLYKAWQLGHPTAANIMKGCTKLIQDDDFKVMVSANKAVDLMEDGLLSLALKEADKAIGLDPKCGWCYSLAAQASFKSGNTELSKEYLVRGIKNAPETAINYIRYASILQTDGSYAESIKYADQFLNMEHDGLDGIVDEDVYIMIGDNYIHLEQMEKACAQYRKANILDKTKAELEIIKYCR